MPLDDALADITSALSKPSQPVGVPPPPSGVDAALADITAASHAPAQSPPVAAPPPPSLGPLGSAVTGLAQNLSAGFQGTSPVVRDAQGRLNYKPLGELFTSDTGPSYADAAGNWHLVDPDQNVVLNDPLTGKAMVYERAPQTNEFWSSIGRILGFGANAPATAPAVAAARTPTDSQALLQDFTRAGVPPSIPAVGQGIGSRLTANVISKVPFIGGPVAGATQDAIRGTGQAVDRLAGTYGAATTPEEAGKLVQQGVQGFVKGETPVGMTPGQIISAPTRDSSFAAKSGALYDRVSSLMNGEAPVDLTNTLDALRGPADRFPNNPALGAAITNPKLKSFHDILVGADPGAADKLAQGQPLSFGELQEFRSYIGRQLSNPSLISDIPRADLKNVYAAMSQDMEKAASAQGPDALQAVQRAGQYYKAGIGRVDQLEPLLNGSPEQTFAAVNQAAGTGTSANAGLLRSLQRSMDPDQWGNVGAAIIRRMGAATPGAKSVLPGAGDFSASSFVTNWNKLSPAARDVLFGANTPGSNREALESLVRVADAQKQMAKFANPSGTASHTIGAGLAGMAAEHFFDLTSHPVETVLGVLGGYGASKALMSPGFARWLYTMPKAMQAPDKAAAWSRSLATLGSMARMNTQLMPVYNALAAAQPPAQ